MGHRAARRLPRWLIGAGWVSLAAPAWLWLSSVAGINWPSVTVLAQSALPFVFLPVWVVLVAALADRHRALAVAAAALAVVHLAIVAPLIRREETPSWVAAAPRLKVFEANLYYANDRKSDAARIIADVDADVVVLAEVTTPWLDALRAAGLLERFPYNVLRPYDRGGGAGSAVLSRLPLLATGTLRMERYNTAPVVTVKVGDREVRIVGVHVQSPAVPADQGTWRHQLEALANEQRAVAGRAIIVGDFNASYWHAPFARLLDHGWRDAHLALGRGLSFSWPNSGGLGALVGPYVRLDHAVVSPTVQPVSVANVDVPGSDHRGFRAEFALGP